MHNILGLLNTFVQHRAQKMGTGRKTVFEIDPATSLSDIAFSTCIAFSKLFFNFWTLQSRSIVSSSKTLPQIGLTWKLCED